LAVKAATMATEQLHRTLSCLEGTSVKISTQCQAIFAGVASMRPDFDLFVDLITRELAMHEHLRCDKCASATGR
jgi:hypothetical protein